MTGGRAGAFTWKHQPETPTRIPVVNPSHALWASILPALWNPGNEPMHEMSLVRGLINQILQKAQEHGASRVSVVRLKLGPLAHIEPGHLTEHFVEASRGTAAERARLEIETTDELHELSLESLDLEVSGSGEGDEK